jgi:omega-hydroxy-beta-dihydromenaquinone-9 sulfotransferase
MSAPSPIFVAGTGRSGTSQLADILGEHPQIHRIPIETRFIPDPGGLRDLADALTIRYDPFVGEDALRRLSDILTVRLVGRIDRDRGHNVPTAIGERHYWDAVGRLWPELVVSTFDEFVPAAGFGHADWAPGPFEPQSYRRAVPRYFSDRSELLEILRRAVDTMFGGAAADAGKPTWCEKTPFNLLCMDFLWELVPEATIVHIKRHPVAVIASHVDQPWAPPTVDGALAWLKPVYDRWLAWKTTADLTTKRYLEVRAEDLAANWPEQRRALFEVLGVDDFATSSTFQPHSLDQRNDQFDTAKPASSSNEHLTVSSQPWATRRGPCRTHPPERTGTGGRSHAPIWARRGARPSTPTFYKGESAHYAGPRQGGERSAGPRRRRPGTLLVIVPPRIQGLLHAPTRQLCLQPP